MGTIQAATQTYKAAIGLRRPVQAPGSPGGKFWIDGVGRIRYGEKPADEAAGRDLSPDEHRQRTVQYLEAAGASRASVGHSTRYGHYAAAEHSEERAKDWERRTHLHKLAAGDLPHIPKADLDDFEGNTDRGFRAVAGAATNLLREHVLHNKKLGLAWGSARHGAEHLAEHLKEKVNLVNTVRELKALGKEHGPVFLAYAVAIELFEDVVLPAFLTSIGKPHLIPLALAFHTEPVLYPLYFGVRKLMKRAYAGAASHGEMIAKALFIGEFLVLTTGHVLKAEQLGFSFGANKPRKEIKAPGSKGGKTYTTSTGHLRYGEKPMPETPNPTAKKRQSGPERQTATQDHLNQAREAGAAASKAGKRQPHPAMNADFMNSLEAGNFSIESIHAMMDAYEAGWKQGEASKANTKGEVRVFESTGSSVRRQWATKDGENWFSRIQDRDPRYGYKWSAWKPSSKPPENTGTSQESADYGTSSYGSVEVHGKNVKLPAVVRRTDGEKR